MTERSLVFRVTEIKLLGVGLAQKLMVHLAGDDENIGQAGGQYSPVASMSVILPWCPGYGRLQIGDRFYLVPKIMWASDGVV